VRTRGVDTGKVSKDLVYLARALAVKRECAVVVTGKDDIVTNGHQVYIVSNGHPTMTNVVGTGCMAASVIGAFCAVERDYALAAACGLACYEAAAEIAAAGSKGPGTFMVNLLDEVHNLDGATADKMAKIAVSE